MPEERPNSLLVSMVGIVDCDFIWIHIGDSKLHRSFGLRNGSNVDGFAGLLIRSLGDTSYLILSLWHILEESGPGGELPATASRC